MTDPDTLHTAALTIGARINQDIQDALMRLRDRIDMDEE